jgi:hypothetical protein
VLGKRFYPLGSQGLLKRALTQDYIGKKIVLPVAEITGFKIGLYQIIGKAVAPGSGFMGITNYYSCGENLWMDKLESKKSKENKGERWFPVTNYPTPGGGIIIFSTSGVVPESDNAVFIAKLYDAESLDETARAELNFDFKCVVHVLPLEQNDGTRDFVVIAQADDGKYSQGKKVLEATHGVTAIFRKGPNMVCGTGENIYYSADTGHTWTLSNTAIDIYPRAVKRNAIVELNGILFAATTKKIIKSDDNGANWTSVFSAPESAPSYEFTGLIKTNNGLIATFNSNYEGGLYRSLDNGATWTRIAGGDDYIPALRYAERIEFIKSRGIAIAVASDKYVYQSNDNGNTWNSIQGTWYTMSGVLINGGAAPYTFTVFDNKLFTMASNGIFHSGPPINFSTGLDEISELPFALYPNPANHEVIINNIPVGSRLTLIDISGRPLQTIHSKDEKTTLTTSHLAKGIYLIQVDVNGVSSVKKLVINR